MPKRKKKDSLNLTLIKAVRSHAILYDATKKTNLDRIRKDKLWVAVAKKCNMQDVQATKSLWRKLRESFRLFHKRRLDGISDRVWRYEKEMSFLQPYVEQQRRKDPPKAKGLKRGKGKMLPDPSPRELGDINDIIEIDDDPYGDFESEFSEQLHATNSPLIDESHQSLKMFFDAMYESTKRFPLPLQQNVKDAIIAIMTITEAEEELKGMPKWEPSSSGLDINHN